MECNRIIVLGYSVYPFTRSMLFQNATLTYEKLLEFCSRKQNVIGRLLLTLKQYLEHTNMFERIYFNITFRENVTFSYNSVRGIMGKINRSEIDIGVNTFTMIEQSRAMTEYSYPHAFGDTTFITQKPEYRP